MSKIMFVEDEISKNIDHYLSLFENIFSDAEKEKIQAAIDLNFDIPATFRKIVAENPVLEFFDSFTDAIKKINSVDDDQLAQYDLFIFDRNLTGINYSVDEIQRYCNNKFQTDIYRGKEGDFLFERLRLRGYPVCNKVYYLTAYSKEALATPTDVDEMVDIGKFTKDHFFDKSSPMEHSKLKKVIDNLENIHLLIQYQDIFKHLSRIGMGDASDNLLQLLAAPTGEISPEDVHGRWILNSLLIAMNHAPEKRFFYRKIEDSNDIYERIKALDTKNKVVPNYIYGNFMLVNELVSKYSAHNRIAESENELPSKYAREVIKNCLLDAISWFIKNF